LAHLDDLTQSIFLDMFGDPDSSTGRWPIVPLSAIVTDLQGGKSLVASDSGGPSVNRVLKISAVTQMYFRPSQCKAVPDDYVPPPNHFVKQGDLLFSRANTTELVGAMAYVWDTPGNLLLPDKLWRFVWTSPEEVEPLYIWALFLTQAMRRELSARSSGTGGSMKNISKAKLLPMQIPLPPYKLQERFRAVVAAQEQLKATLRTQSSELDGLFASLQSRAFAGEL
jgi:type I restriction enzyme S subunit